MVSDSNVAFVFGPRLRDLMLGNEFGSDPGSISADKEFFCLLKFAACSTSSREYNNNT